MGHWQDQEWARVAGWHLRFRRQGNKSAGSSRPVRPNNCRETRRSPWASAGFALALILLLLVAGRFTPAQADPGGGIMLPLIIGGDPQAPTAVEDSYQTDEDTQLVINPADGVLANDSDPQLDPLQAILVADVSHGVLNLKADGSFDYTPAPDFNGQDSFTYRATAGVDNSNPAQVTLTVKTVNDVPVAVDDSYQTTEDTILLVDAANGVLANDSDADMDSLQAIVASDVSNGELDLKADGSFDYEPDPDFNGQDSFTYRAGDGVAASKIAQVTLTVKEVSAEPVAADDGYQTAEDTQLIVGVINGVLANDSDPQQDPLQAVLVDNVSSGVLNLNADGSLNYMPALDFNGIISFTYRASDGKAVSDPATVTLTVSPVNDAPVATDDNYDTPEDTPLVVGIADGVLANDSDPDLDPLQAILVDNVSSGVLNLNADGSLNYVPALNYNGTISFTYRAADSALESNLATVTLTVNPVNDAPVATNDDYQTGVDTKLVVNAAQGTLANDSDPELDPLQASLEGDVGDGVLNLKADGSFDYTPDPGFKGQDSFTYRANDTLLASNLATVTIIVDTPNQPPHIVSGKVEFTKEIIGTGVKQTHAVVAADMDNDGDIDAAATDFVNDRVLWYENDGSGNFTERTLDDNLDGAYPAHVGDVDQDGDADVFAGGYDGDTFVWYRNDGGGNFTRIVIDNKADGAHSIITVDLDEDGHIDFVTTSQDAGNVAWYENDGTNKFSRHIIDKTLVKAKRAEVADIDGDNDWDIVTASYTNDEISWFENDGNESFTKHVITIKRNGAYFASPADVDGDDDMDILTASKLDNTIALYRNDGSEDFDVEIIDDKAEGARMVLAMDLDHDGDADALATSKEDGTVAWFENDGSGNFNRHIIDKAADGAYGIFGADMDLDGDLDVLSAARNSAEISIYTQFQAHEATVAKGGTLTIDSSMLLTEDPDDGPAGLIYTITEAPTRGEIQLDGVPVLQGSSFTQDDVNKDRVTYMHGGSKKPSDGFSFSVIDGGENGVQPATGTFSIEITGLVVLSSLLPL